MKSILVVCEGNICRSPMAEAVLQVALPNIRVTSAGLGALIGMPPDPLAIRLMSERGIDISAHRATQISRQACFDADLILVMDKMQRLRIEETYPQVHGRVFKVGEHTNNDVPDPYRKSEQAFRDSLEVIDEGVSQWLRRIERL